MASEYVAPTTSLGSYAAVNGIQIYYEEAGAGPAVILLHGGLMDHQSWGNQIPDLAKSFRVIAPDTRAHGRSSDTDQAFSYDMFASDALGLLEALQIERSHVVGFSDGGASGLIMAMRRPDVVEKLVLVGTAYSTSNYFPGTTEQWKTLTWDTLKDVLPPVHLEINLKAKALYPDEQSFERFWRKLVNDLWVREPTLTLTDLATIEAPTLVLHGEHEQYIERRTAEEIANAVPQGKFRIVPGTHTCAQEHPTELNSAIASFFAAAPTVSET